MNISQKAVGIAMLTTFWAANAYADTSTSYTTIVHLADGKHVECAVNQPLSTGSGQVQAALSRRERNEAELRAIARIPRRFQDKNSYPSPGTAPRVDCIPISWASTE